MDISSLPNNVYYAMKSAMMTQESYQLRYPSQNWIPNRLKTNEQKRALIIQYLSPNNSKLLQNIVRKNTNIDIHVASGSCLLIKNNNDFKILHSHKSYRINKQILQNNEITIQSRRFATILGIDVYEKDNQAKETHTNTTEQFTYFPSLEDIKWRQSFVRMDLTVEEIHERLLFIDVECARSTENKSIPISVVAFNYDGKKVFDSLAYPRQVIRNYGTKFHGLKEKDLLGKIDSEELKEIIQKMVKGKIVVGSDLHLDLQSLGINPKELCGIRDLANGPIIREKTQSKKQFMKLQEMVKDILEEDIQTSYHGAEEDAKAVWKIYKKVESEWIDHSGCIKNYELKDIRTVIYSENQIDDEFIFEEEIMDEEFLSVHSQPSTPHDPETIEEDHSEPQGEDHVIENENKTFEITGTIKITYLPNNAITISITPSAGCVPIWN